MNKKVLIITQRIQPSIRNSYTGSWAYHLTEYVKAKGVNADILEVLNDLKGSNPFRKINLDGYHTILFAGLQGVDRILCKNTQWRKPTGPFPKVAQVSDSPLSKESKTKADITFSTKVVPPEKAGKNVYVGWGCNPEDFINTKNDSSKEIYILIDHPHYQSDYDETPDAISFVDGFIEYVSAKHPSYTIKAERIADGELVEYNSKIKPFNRKGINYNEYADALGKTHIFLTSHRESVGLSILDAATAGALVVSKRGHIYSDRLETVNHIEYDDPRKVDYSKVFEQCLKSEDNRRQALENSWEKVFDRLFEGIDMANGIHRGKGNIGHMYPTIISFYTDTWKYKEYAEALAQSCRKLGLNYYIKEIEDTGNWSENTRIKPFFIREAIRTLKRPVLWIDADGMIQNIPRELLLPLSVDFLGRHQRIGPKRTWHVGTMVFNYSDEVLTFVDKWCESVSGSISSDEAAFETVWLKYHEDMNISSEELPETYFKILYNQTLDKPESADIIAHRLSACPAKIRFKAEKEKQLK